jgi:O-antigen ligase
VNPQEKEFLGKILISGISLTTILVTPWWALDPINPIKLLVLTTTATVGFLVVAANRYVLKSKNYRPIGFLLTAFAFWLIVVFFCSGANKAAQLFGVTGRNTGVITYVSLAIVLFLSVLVSSRDLLKKFTRAALILGGLSALYGAIQAFKLDPIPWVNPYSPVVGFLGNPNFQASFLGLISALVFALILNNQLKRSVRGMLLSFLGLLLIVILKSESQQGFLVFLIGSSITLLLYIRQIQSRALTWSYLVVGTISFFGMAMGILNKGPLASILHKDSVTFREDYWVAGWRMSIENPIFGVGLDSYGDWYRRSRTLTATLRRGPDVVSNASHNVFLDLSSNGGFVLLTIYLGILALVVKSAYSVVKRSTSYDPVFTAILAGWIGYQAQSVISINQIGLAIWGWILSGLLIGYEINTRGANETPFFQHKLQKKLNSKIQVSPVTNLFVFLGLILGVAAGGPPYLASTKYKTALESGNREQIRASAYIRPLDMIRFNQVTAILLDNNLEQDALSVIEDAVVAFPDSYDAWRIFASIKIATPEQVSTAKAQMKRLDPLNPNLK